MAKGEKRFSTRGREARKFDSTPPPPGEYDMKLRGSEAKVGKKNEPGSFPYVSLPIELLGTGQDGGKNRVIFHMFFCSLKPGKDGSLMAERADQLVGLSKAAGTDIDVGTLTLRDADGNPQDCLNPADLVKWLKENDGITIRGKTRIQAGDEKRGYGPKGVVSYFIESEDRDADADEEDEDEELEDEDESDDDADEDDDSGDEEDDEDEDEDESEDEDDDIDHSPKPASKPAKQSKLPLKGKAKKSRK